MNRICALLLGLLLCGCGDSTSDTSDATDQRVESRDRPLTEIQNKPGDGSASSATTAEADKGKKPTAISDELRAERKAAIAALRKEDVYVDVDSFAVGPEEEAILDIGFGISDLDLRDEQTALRVSRLLAPISAQIESLHIPGPGPIHAACFQNVDQMPNLKRIAAPIDADGVAAISGATTLESLTAVRGSHYDDRALPHFRKLVNLTWLELKGTDTSDLGLKHLAALEKLESLNIDGTRVTGTGFAHLNCRNTLRTVFASHSGVTDAGLKVMATFPHISFLSLNGTKVTDDGISHLQALDGLDSLLLDNTTVTGKGLQHITLRRHLNANDTAFDDSGLEILAGNAPDTFDYLSLAGTGITDSGLEHVHALSGLRRINLERTKVTQEGINRLKKHFPDCLILWEPSPE